MKNLAENVHQKLVPEPFLVFLNNPKQSFHARNCFKMRYFEQGLSKSFKKLNFIFSFGPNPF